MIEFKVSEREAQMLIASISVCAPSGGGSPQYTLERKLREQHEAQVGVHMDVTEALAQRFLKVVIEEAMDAGAIQQQELKF